MARPSGSGRRAAWLGAAGAAGAAGAGVFAMLRGRRERRLKRAVEGIEATVLPPGQSAEPVIDLTATESGPGHAPGHQHLSPPPDAVRPGDGGHREHGYRSGHRDRGGRSIAFRTRRER